MQGRRARTRGSAEQQAGFDLDRLAVEQVGLESPLQQRLFDALRLLWKGAQEMNVLNPPFLIDHNPHGNRVESRLGENRVYAFKHSCGSREVLQAQRSAAAGLNHGIHACNQPLHGFWARSCEYELHHMTTDFRCQHMPMQSGDVRYIVEADKITVRDPHPRRRSFYPIFGAQMLLKVTDEFRCAVDGRQAEK